MPWALNIQTPLPYAQATRIQLALQQRRIADEIPDTFLLLEHPSVITLGRRGRKNFLLTDDAQLKQRNTDLVTASRGGDVTWHGPGQLICYPIVKVSDLPSGSHGFLEKLEQVAIDTAKALGVEAYRQKGKAGAWTQQGKIAAIGFALKRWVSCHGLSFNLNPDLSHFDLIIGCGLVGDTVSSIQRMLGDDCPTMNDTRQAMYRVLCEQFSPDLELYAEENNYPDAIKELFNRD